MKIFIRIVLFAALIHIISSSQRIGHHRSSSWEFSREDIKKITKFGESREVNFKAKVIRESEEREKQRIRLSQVLPWRPYEQVRHRGVVKHPLKIINDWEPIINPQGAKDTDENMSSPEYVDENARLYDRFRHAIVESFYYRSLPNEVFSPKKSIALRTSAEIGLRRGKGTGQYAF